MTMETKDIPLEEQTESTGEFIRETVETPPTGRGLLRALRVVFFLLAAVAFGLIGCLTAIISRPWVERMLGTGDPRPGVVIPRDPVEETEAESESETETEAALEVVIDEAMVEAMVDRKMEKYLQNLQEATIPEEEGAILERFPEVLSNSLLYLAPHAADEDVWDSMLTAKNQVMGLIIGKTETEILILTDYGFVKGGADVILDGRSVVTEQRGADPIFGMAVLAASKETLEPEEWERLTPAILGNSYMVHQGDEVAAVGKPLGYAGSAAEGSVAYVNILQQGSDMIFQLIQTDIPADRTAGGFLLNDKGQVVGWITQAYNSDSMSSVLAAISMSDLKGLVENMVNGRKSGYLGIEFRNVTPAVAEAQQIPKGICITKCLNDSPAYTEGLQRGDILTGIDGEDVNNEYDFERIMEKHFAEDTVKITVMRLGRNGYRDITYDIQLAAR